MIDFEIENQLRPDLDTDERLIWTGRPKRGIVFRRSDIFLIPFSLLWGGFAVFWETSVWVMDAPLLFKIWGIPFVLAGGYIIIGRFFLDAKRRANTLYAITTNRVVIKSGIVNKNIQSLNIRTLSDISVTEKADGSGTILLGPADPRYKAMQGWDFSGGKQPPRLDMIEDAKSVYDKIIRIQQQQRPES